MDSHRPSDAILRELFESAKTIAVVGLSSKRSRPSFGVARYMQSAGYRIIPVNPNESEVHGEKAYPSLESIAKDIKIDIVDIFRRSGEVPAVVESAIGIGAHAVWMQEGVVHEEAAARARAAGLIVIMDHCILKEHRRLMD